MEFLVKLFPLEWRKTMRVVLISCLVLGFFLGLGLAYYFDQV
jgi:TRAP-type C4-dicarboxylate transport system permease small subunit